MHHMGLWSDSLKMKNEDEFVKKHSVEGRPLGEIATPWHATVPMKNLDPSEIDDWHSYHKEMTPKSVKRVNKYAADIKKNGSEHYPPLLVHGEIDHNKLRPQVVDGHHRGAALYKNNKNSRVRIYYTDHTLRALHRRVRKVLDEDAVPANATGAAISGTDPTDPTTPKAKLLGMVSRLRKKKQMNGRLP